MAVEAIDKPYIYASTAICFPADCIISMEDYSFFFLLLQMALLVPYFFLFRFLFKRMRIKAPSIYAAIVAILFVIVCCKLFNHYNRNYLYPKIRSEKFNTQKWHSAKNERFKMARDIIASNMLIGKTQQEVTAILGAPSSERGSCETCIGYPTHEPGFSIDHEVLVVEFDENNGRATLVRLDDW